MALFFQPDIRAPLRPRSRASRHRHRRHHRPGRHPLPARTRRPVRVRVPAHDRPGRTHPRHRSTTSPTASPWGRLCPPMLACLDELPSTAPLPTLRTRMANERALGISFIYAAQTWRQLAAVFGDTEARALYGLTNVIVVFGGGKDIGFNKEISDLVGTTRVTRTTWQLGRGGGRSASGDDMLIIRPEEVRQLPERQALVIAENTKPIIAKLTRSIDGKRRTPPAHPANRTSRQPTRRPPASIGARAVMVESVDDRSTARRSRSRCRTDRNSAPRTRTSTSSRKATTRPRRRSATPPCYPGPGTHPRAASGSCARSCGSGSMPS